MFLLHSILYRILQPSHESALSSIPCPEFLSVVLQWFNFHSALKYLEVELPLK